MGSKQSMREEHVAYRRHLRANPSHKRDLDAAITAHATAFLDSIGSHTAQVAAYQPLASEPGGDGFLPAVTAHCQTLFLPVTRPDGVLNWALYPAAEPSTGQVRDSGFLSSLDALIIPALGVDAAGMRLGKGGGYYDRALSGVRTPTVAVVYEREFVDTVPSESHDIPVNAVITENGLHFLDGTSGPQ